MKERYDFIFIVLTYRNASDLEDFLESAQDNIKESYKVVVVNSYFDENSKLEIERIALNRKCDFINIPNNGYGAGNNYGIKYIKENYEYEYLIISNPDILIEKLEINDFNKYKNTIIAPQIKNLFSKNQNPHLVFDIGVLEKIKYFSFKKNNKYLLMFAIGINKIIRNLFLLYTKIIDKQTYKIFSPHGSFIIFDRNFIEQINSLFNEDIFLFTEEDHLAKLAKKLQINVLYVPSVKVRHKEDGSILSIQSQVSTILRESYIKYYEYWNYTK